MQKVNTLILWGIAFLSACSLSVKGNTTCIDITASTSAKSDMNEPTPSPEASTLTTTLTTSTVPAATISCDTNTHMHSSGAMLLTSSVASTAAEPSTSAPFETNTSMFSSATPTEGKILSPDPSASSSMTMSMSILTAIPTTLIPLTTTTVTDPLTSNHFYTTEHMSSSGTSSLTLEAEMKSSIATPLDTTTHVHLKTTIMSALPTPSTVSPGYSRSPLTLTAIIVGVTVGLVALFLMMPFCIVFAFVMCN